MANKGNLMHLVRVLRLSLIEECDISFWLHEVNNKVFCRTMGSSVYNCLNKCHASLHVQHASDVMCIDAIEGLWHSQIKKNHQRSA